MTRRSSERRILRWENVKGPRAISALVVGTALGAGLFPIAPGTMGTLIAMPLAYWTADWSDPVRALLWIALTFAGTWAAKVFDETMGTSDNQNIVIDEVVGYGITAWTAGTHPRTMVAAFVIFRILDVLKPWPIRKIDTWSKKRSEGKSDEASRWWSGFGVMADDVLAGFEGLLLIWILQRYSILP